MHHFGLPTQFQVVDRREVLLPAESLLPLDWQNSLTILFAINSQALGP